MPIPPMRNDVQKRGLTQLCDWAKQQGARDRAVEIGAYAGEGTVIFAAHFGEVVAVDPWVNGYDDGDLASYQAPMETVFGEWQARTAPFPNIRHIRATAADAAAHFGDGSLDFVYVDGDHRYGAVLSDLTLYLPKLKKGGVMSGHDLSFVSVQTALREVFGERSDPTLFDGDSWGLVV